MGFDNVKLSFFVLALASITSPALAADVLFVDDFNYNTNIPAVLEADGHDVTVATSADFDSYSVLQADLSAFQVVIWSGSFEPVAAGVFDNLVAYVTGGGRVFYTGCDAMPSADANEAFLGISTSDDDLNSRPGAILAIDNHLTTGLFDIRGVVPAGGFADRDRALALEVGTVGVTPSGAGGWNWTLRTLGAGEIAYVSNGGCDNYSAHFSWRDTSADGYGVYNAALRNFVAASGGAATPLPSTCVATDNGNGSYTIECPDGSSVTINDGMDGSDGADGTDGTQGANGSDGVDGANGTNGSDGADGSSCMAINNNDGTYTVTCEDGSSVVLADGAAGSNGTNGVDGSNGTNGADGSNGTNGADGSNGTNGADGSNGTNGADGSNGTNGADGSNGTNGADGSNGTNGADGSNGEGCTVTNDGAASATITCADGTSVAIDAPEAAGGCSVAGSFSGATSTSAMVLGALGVLFVRRRKA